MKLDKARHYDRVWRVHELARDFELIDVWEIPIQANPARNETFRDFYRLVVANGPSTDSRATQALLRTREALGRVFGWDRDKHSLPIPGCRETSLADRLTEEDRRRSRADQGSMPKQQLVDLKAIYLFEDEFLGEVSNDTIHALLHLGWVDRSDGLMTAQLAIYVKPRSGWSDLYMTLIRPFRHLIVYPAWIRSITQAWEVWVRQRELV
jgi:uncharacterized protein DUF2867